MTVRPSEGHGPAAVGWAGERDGAYSADFHHLPVTG